MSPTAQVMAIIDRVLEVRFEDWEYEIEGPTNVAFTRQSGWSADLHYQSAEIGALKADHLAFLRQYRSASAAYKIELWVDDFGLVLFAILNDDTSYSELRHGHWETHYFELPSPPAERRLEYI